METKLTTNSGNGNPIADNYSGNIPLLVEALKQLLLLPSSETYARLESKTNILETTVKCFIGSKPLAAHTSADELHFNEIYLINFYIDNELHISMLSCFIGMKGDRWLAFQNLQNDSVHLLSVDSEFPTYTAEPFPGTIITEQYFLI